MTASQWFVSSQAWLSIHTDAQVVRGRSRRPSPGTLACGTCATSMRKTCSARSEKGRSGPGAVVFATNRQAIAGVAVGVTTVELEAIVEPHCGFEKHPRRLGTIRAGAFASTS